LYQINGGDVLTSALNTDAEALNSVNRQYDVFTFALSNFAALSGGSATVHLTFAGPGGGILGPVDFNGGAIVFSTLDITTDGNGGPGPGPVVPEPASLLLVATGLGMGLRSRIRRFRQRP
jgi:hypothetical protein